MVVHWCPSDSKSSLRYRTLLTILADLNNDAVWMVSICPAISNSSNLLSKPLWTVPSAPITIGITVTHMFQVLISLFTFFQFYSVVSLDSKVDNFAHFLFLMIIIRSGLLAEIRWSVCISKSHRSLCVSFSKTAAGLCIYHLLAWSNLNFLHISQWINWPTQSCLALYSFFANLLHSLVMWLMSRVFTNVPRDRGSILGRVIPKTPKMVLDAALLNTQHYKVWIKGKVVQSTLV